MKKPTVAQLRSALRKGHFKPEERPEMIKLLEKGTDVDSFYRTLDHIRQDRTLSFRDIFLAALLMGLEAGLALGLKQGEKKV